MVKASFFIAVVLVLTGCLAGPVESQAVTVAIQTRLGDIVVKVDTTKAPLTAHNFLRYVDGGFYEGGSFYRAVRLDNQPTARRR
ncbi:MAG: peptidyl-prolyl cis-trans isomerase A (cyclophilin A) [Rhodothermales bacterium]|jgi:peptidyl-prolyl cis-trans isomerase A (cyclophilin A)